jgi:hypothetical protein
MRIEHAILPSLDPLLNKTSTWGIIVTKFPKMIVHPSCEQKTNREHTHNDVRYGLSIVVEASRTIRHASQRSKRARDFLLLRMINSFKVYRQRQFIKGLLELGFSLFKQLFSFLLSNYPRVLRRKRSNLTTGMRHTLQQYLLEISCPFISLSQVLGTYQ